MRIGFAASVVLTLLPVLLWVPNVSCEESEVLQADSCGISLHSALKEAREVLLVDPDEEIDGSGEHAKVVMDPEQLSGFLRAGIDALRNTTDVTVLSIVDSLLTLVISRVHLTSQQAGDCFVHIGVIQHLQHNYSKALLLYSLALAENSHDIRALQNLLFLYVQQGFTEQAAVLERQLTALRRGDVHPPTPSWPKTRFALVTVGMPDNNNTFYVFEEIAETVHRGLLELGLDSVRSYCSDLFARCATSIGVDGRQVILFASHKLSSYQYTSSSAPGGAKEGAAVRLGLLAPDTILFNFELIVNKTKFGEWFTDAFVTAHRSFRVWDYSWENRDNWQQYGVQATVVPLGCAGNWDGIAPLVYSPPPVKDIDVLFFGSDEPRRIAILRAIILADIKLKFTPTKWGDDLYALVKRAKVVLVLKHFDSDDEFKLSRLMVSFAHSTLAVVERMGSERDVGYFRPGFVEVASPQYDPATDDMVPHTMVDMLEKLRYYVSHDKEREALAANGKRLFSARRMSTMLARALEEEAVRGEGTMQQ